MLISDLTENFADGKKKAKKQTLDVLNVQVSL